MHDPLSNSPILNRRQALFRGGLGAGGIAFASLAAGDDSSQLRTDAKPTQAHFEPTAKRIIFLFMSGGPSQVDTWDPKPELAQLNGRDVPERLASNIPRIKRAGLHNLMASPFKFAQNGDSGLWVSELLPETAKHVDDICVLRSMHHRNPVHGPGECVALTGTAAGDRPSFGSWVTYGLGSENENLPAYIAMNLNTDGMQYPQASGWGAGFLPASLQGTVVSPQNGIRNVKMPEGTTDAKRRRQLDLIEWLNRKHLESVVEHSELDARLRSYELAFRMQVAAPELFDISKETATTRAMYGMEQATTKLMGHACLLARRMAERGVRFIQLRFGGWDAHGNLKGNHEKMSAKTDLPVAALLADLRQRDLLDDTLVVWGGEFGRTPTMEGRGKGRDHNPSGYTMWLAGGGVKGGQVVGQTDPIGYVPVERPIRVSDFHATLLHALGLDQHKLTYLHNGREELATVLGGDVVREVFA